MFRKKFAVAGVRRNGSTFTPQFASGSTSPGRNRLRGVLGGVWRQLVRLYRGDTDRNYSPLRMQGESVSSEVMEKRQQLRRHLQY